MSSKPSPEGATQLIATWKQLSDNEANLHRVAAQLDKATSWKQALLEENRRLQDAFDKQLDAMDCASQGNAGWRGRATWLFREIIRQATAEAQACLKDVAHESFLAGHLRPVDITEVDDAFERWWKDREP